MLTKSQQFIHRRSGKQARVEQIKPVIVMAGKHERHTHRYRMSGTNEFLTEDQVLRVYDVVAVKEPA